MDVGKQSGFRNEVLRPEKREQKGEEIHNNPEI